MTKKKQWWMVNACKSKTADETEKKAAPSTMAREHSPARSIQQIDNIDIGLASVRFDGEVDRAVCVVAHIVKANIDGELGKL